MPGQGRATRVRAPHRVHARSSVRDGAPPTTPPTWPGDARSRCAASPTTCAATCGPPAGRSRAASCARKRLARPANPPAAAVRAAQRPANAERPEPPRWCRPHRCGPSNACRSVRTPDSRRGMAHSSPRYPQHYAAMNWSRLDCLPVITSRTRTANEWTGRSTHTDLFWPIRVGVPSNPRSRVSSETDIFFWRCPPGRTNMLVVGPVDCAFPAQA